MADKPGKTAKGLAWLVRKMGFVDAVEEFKDGYKPDPQTQARQDADAVEESMRKLALRIVQYRARHGHFPRALADLMQQGLVQAQELVASGDEEAPEKPPSPLPAFEEGDYVYFPLEDDCDGDMILMYEPPDRHEGKGTHVTLAKGQVVWMDIDRFQRERKRTEEYLAGKRQG